MKHLLMGVVAIISLSVAILPQSASADCGSITYVSFGSPRTEAIEDCDNPFEVTQTDLPDGFFFTIEDTSVTKDISEVAIKGESTNDLQFTELSGRWEYAVLVLEHTGNNYQEIDFQLQPAEAPSQTEQLALLEDYFSGDPDVLLYRTALETNDTDHLTREQESEYYAFLFDIIEPLYSDELVFPELPVGTYTFVFYENQLCVTQADNTWRDKFLNIFIKTAHAQFCSGDFERFAVTLTLTQAPPEPTGASSVLFLPGFQASRLYTKESDGSEKLLWEPDFVFDDDDILRLAMDEQGTSIENIYVRDIIDYAPQDPEPENAVYAGFVSFLDALVNQETIEAFETFAYDWRYSVNDIIRDGVQYENEVRYAQETVTALAAASHTGQVTVVGHSNGGLLGKALISYLAAEGEEDLVDQFIMIGTPQLGTPKAIGSLLHGSDQGLSHKLIGPVSVPIITDAAVREAARNMPGAYGLLPGQAYFEEANDIIVLFDTSEITTPWRQAYGNTINTQSELDDFLVSTVNGRDTVLYQSTNEAIQANPTILAEARIIRTEQDSWQSPDSIETTAIIGTGRNTMSGFEYTAFIEQICDESTSGCVEKDIYKPVPIISQRGDQTVMTASAVGVDESTEKFFVDLAEVRSVEEFTIQHANFTETRSVQNLLSNLFQATTTQIDFVSSTEPTYDDQQLLLGTHSPVYLYIEDAQGRQTGQLSADEVVEEIPDTQWFSHAGSSYVIVLVGLEYTVYINSYAAGGMTFTSHRITAEGQSLEQKTPVTVITASTSITITYDGQFIGNLIVDEDDDGVPDREIQADGTIIELTVVPEIPISETTTAAQSNRSGTRLSLPEPQVAGAVIQLPNTADLSRAVIIQLLSDILNRLRVLQSIL